MNLKDTKMVIKVLNDSGEIKLARTLTCAAFGGKNNMPTKKDLMNSTAIEVSKSYNKLREEVLDKCRMLENEYKKVGKLLGQLKSSISNRKAVSGTLDIEDFKQLNALGDISSRATDRLTDAISELNKTIK